MIHKIKIIIKTLLVFCFLIACKNIDKKQNTTQKHLKNEITIQQDTLKKVLQSTQFLKIDRQQSIKADSVSKKTSPNLDITIASLTEKKLYTTYDPENYKIEDYIFNTYWRYSTSSPKEKFLNIPYIIKHPQGLFFNYDSYPEDLIVRTIPNTIDTLYITKTNTDCYDCIDITKIHNNHKELYYKITKDDGEIIALKGNLDSLLIERGLTVDSLDNEVFDSKIIKNWKEDTEFYENIKEEYNFSHNIRLKKKPSVLKIKTEIDKLNFNFSSLDSLKFIYTKYTNTNDLITIDNFLTHEKKYQYFHSGGIYSEMEKKCMTFIESIDIVYISKKNKLFKVRWLANYSEETNTSPLDDNYVDFKNNSYKINNWSSGKKINLFHPDMQENKYLVVYELKLKYLDTYIHSPIEIIDYEIPK